MPLPAFISRFLETIVEWSKGGGQAAAGTKPATRYSNVYTLLQVMPSVECSPDTLQAKPTLQMDPPAVYIPPYARCSHQSPSQPSSVPSSRMSPAALSRTTHAVPDHHMNRFFQWSKSTSQRNSNDVLSSTKNISAMGKNSLKR